MRSRKLMTAPQAAQTSANAALDTQDAALDAATKGRTLSQEALDYFNEQLGL